MSTDTIIQTSLKGWKKMVMDRNDNDANLVNFVDVNGVVTAYVGIGGSAKCFEFGQFENGVGTINKLFS